MGKTFKYGYSGHSLNSLERHADAKVGDIRRVRRSLKDNTRAEINENDYSNCHKFEPSKNGYSESYPRSYKPNATASWYKSNANIVWEERDKELIGDTGTNTTILITTCYNYWHDDFKSHNISRGYFLKDKDLIGKKQLKRRNEIGKISLLNRNADCYNEY